MNKEEFKKIKDALLVDINYYHCKDCLKANEEECDGCIIDSIKHWLEGEYERKT